MENDPQNLKIRVVMKPATTAGGESAQYRTNWIRVAVIAVPVILLLGLTAKFVLDKPQTSPPAEVASTPASSIEAPLPKPPAAQPQAAEPEAADTSPVATAAAISEQDVLERARQLAADNAVAQDTLPTEPAPEQPVFSVEQSAQAPAAAEPAVAITESAPASTASKLQPGQTRKLSAKVKRFQLTNAIADKEPRGDIEDIQPGPDGVLRVYVFSEVTNMKDDVIHYRWIRNDKQQANVKIGVWSNRWRSNSSKYITANMHGDWQVRMENKNGELLAEASFSY